MNAPSKKEVEVPWVLREDKDGIATLTLNRGDRMNPLSTAMLAALQAELDRVAKDGDAKLVVLAGGPRRSHASSLRIRFWRLASDAAAARSRLACAVAISP